jgi:ABC-type phosphate transport system substrate-binding protein
MQVSLKTTRRALVACAVLLAAGSSTHTAQADDPACDSLPNPVYVTGSTAVQPFLAGLGTVLAGGNSPMTIVYKNQGSCTGVDAILNGTKITGTALYWDTSGTTPKTCNLPTAGQTADIGVADVFATSCTGVGNTIPSDVHDFFGPVQTMTFIAPKASSHTSISAEAAYLTFGLGQAGKTPWDNEQLLFVRNAQSGTQTMIGTAIKVPADKFKGIDTGGSNNVVTDVSGSADPDHTIGIVSSGEADNARDKVKILAFQDFGQKCGRWPDSSLSARDKQNVRDGHYPIWGPVHMLAKVDSSNNPVNPQAAALLGYITGKTPVPAGVNLLDLEITAGTVPICAMNVMRTSEVGPVSAYTDPAPCGCYFDSKTKPGGSTCQVCSADGDCTGSAKHCRYGFCEEN